MSTTTDVARLILEAESRGFDDARDKIKLVEGSLAALTDSYKDGAIGYADYVREGAALRSMLDADKAALRQAEEAIKKYGSAQKALSEVTEEATKGAGDFGQSMLQGGRVIQDFAQGGLGGILNNIEGFTQAIGGGGGAAGALTILGVGFMLLKPHIAEFIKSLGSAESATDIMRGKVGQLEDRIKELQEKPIRLMVEEEELDSALRKLKTLQEGQAALEAFAKAHTNYEKQSGQATQEALVESKEGAPTLKQGMVDQLVKEKTEEEAADIAKDEAEQAQAEKDQATARDAIENSRDANGSMGAMAAAIAAEERGRNAKERNAARAKAIKASAEQDAGGIIKQAGEGDQWAHGQLVDLLGRSGFGDLAKGVAATSAKEMEGQDAIDDRLEASNERAKNARKERMEKAKKAVADAMRTILGGKEVHANASEVMKGIQSNKGLRMADGTFAKAETDEQQYDLMRRLIEAELRAQLEARGLDTEGSKSAIEGASNQVAGNVRTKLESDATAARHKAETAAQTAKHKAETKAEADRKKAETANEKLEDQSIEQGGYVEGAQGLLAQARAQGGAFDQYGRFHQMSEAQIQAYVQRQVALSLHRVVGADRAGRPVRANADMDAARTNQLAGKIAGRANAGLDARMSALAAQGMDATMAIQQIVGEAQAQIGHVEARVRNIEATNRQLRSNSATLRRAVMPPTPTNLPGGGP